MKLLIGRRFTIKCEMFPKWLIILISPYLINTTSEYYLDFSASHSTKEEDAHLTNGVMLRQGL